MDIGWRDFFADPRLDALIAAALVHNRDLAVSVARIEVARGFYRIQGAERYPAPVVAAGASRSHNGRRRGGFPWRRRASRSIARRSTSRVNQFELDFWGRVRDLTESARADYLATVQAQRAFRLSLIQDVAATYLASIETAEQIRLADTTVRSRREGVRITQVRFRAGITSALDLHQAESLLAQAEASLAALRLTQVQLNNQLLLLVGGPVAGPLPPPLPLDAADDRHRPGGGRCPRSCCSRGRTCSRRRNGSAPPRRASARRAPRSFRRSRSPAYSGSPRAALNSLVGSDGLTWSYAPLPRHADLQPGPTPRQPDRRSRARERSRWPTTSVPSRSRSRRSRTRWRAGSISPIRWRRRSAGTVAQRQIAALARTRYIEGVVNFLEVLDAERNLFASEQQLLRLRRANVENLVALYIALGGGAVERR